MGAPVALPFHPAVARYTWNDQFLMVPLADDVDTDFAFEELKSFIRRSPPGVKVGMCVLIRDGAKPPTPERRERTRTQMAIIEPNIAHTATVILGAGFFASLFLGVAGTMMRLRPTQTPRLLSQKLPEFAQWVAQHSNAKVTSFEVLSAVNWMLTDVEQQVSRGQMLAAG